MTRLTDEFGPGTGLSGLKKDCLVFADLAWDVSRDVVEKAKGDPAFVIEGERRMVAFHRIAGEIRYYAGPRGDVLGADDRDRDSELGVIASVEDAVALATQYLDGASLKGIKADRSTR